jgi:hypothetical protein
MKTSWLQGLEKERAIDVRQNFKESLVLRKRFFEIVYEMIESSRKAQVSKDLYESPSWGYQQADRIGYERALRDILELFKE